MVVIVMESSAIWVSVRNQPVWGSCFFLKEFLIFERWLCWTYIVYLHLLQMNNSDPSCKWFSIRVILFYDWNKNKPQRLPTWHPWHLDPFLVKKSNNKTCSTWMHTLNKKIENISPRWWFQIFHSISSPLPTWGDDSIWRTHFFRWKKPQTSHLQLWIFDFIGRTSFRNRTFKLYFSPWVGRHLSIERLQEPRLVKIEGF